MIELVRFTESSFHTQFPSPFGSSIYNHNREPIAQAFDTVIRDSNPTSHGEINAIGEACRTLKTLSLKGCTLYSACEPCPMCMSACIWAELDAVVYGASSMEDANKFWPQASDLTPRELIERSLPSPKCQVIPNVQRKLCQDLFLRCNQTMLQARLILPPHR